MRLAVLCICASLCLAGAEVDRGFFGNLINGDSLGESAAGLFGNLLDGDNVRISSPDSGEMPIMEIFSQPTHHWALPVGKPATKGGSMFCMKGTSCGADGQCETTCKGNCCKKASRSEKQHSAWPTSQKHLAAPKIELGTLGSLMRPLDQLLGADWLLPQAASDKADKSSDDMSDGVTDDFMRSFGLSLFHPIDSAVRLPRTFSEPTSTAASHSSSESSSHSSCSRALSCINGKCKHSCKGSCCAKAKPSVKPTKLVKPKPMRQPRRQPSAVPSAMPTKILPGKTAEINKQFIAYAALKALKSCDDTLAHDKTKLVLCHKRAAELQNLAREM